MTRTLAAVVLAAALALPAAIAAQEPAPAGSEPEPITEGTAKRLPDGKVELSVTWQGGACDEPGEAEVNAGDQTTDEVTIPVSRVGEVCTLQIVPVEFTGTIPVEPATTTLSVMVLDPEGQPAAGGDIEIED